MYKLENNSYNLKTIPKSSWRELPKKSPKFKYNIITTADNSASSGSANVGPIITPKLAQYPLLRPNAIIMIHTQISP